MVLRSVFGFRCFYKFLRPQSTSLTAISPLCSSAISCSSFPTYLELLSPLTFSRRKFSDTAQLVSQNAVEDRIEAEADVVGIGYVRLSESDEENGCSEEGLGEGELPSLAKLKEIKGLELKSMNLESNVKGVKGNAKITEAQKNRRSEKEEREPSVQSKLNSLYSLFVSNHNSSKTGSLKYKKKTFVLKQERRPSSAELKPLEEVRPVARELSPEMISLISRFYEEGLLNNANFLPLKKLELSSFSNPYFRDFLIFTAERFGQDHQEIAKWLSGSHLKEVALFGCPSVERKTTFAAKRLRSFFSIHEDTVCQYCKLRSSCKFVNKKVLSKVNNVNLADTMRVLTLYGLGSVPIELVVPKEVNDSISKLLQEVINLSE